MIKVVIGVLELSGNPIFAVIVSGDLGEQSLL